MQMMEWRKDVFIHQRQTK